MYVFAVVCARTSCEEQKEMEKEETSDSEGEKGELGEQDEEAELEVVLDDEGRIMGTSSVGLNFDFYSCENSHLTSPDSSQLDIVSVLKNDVDAIFDGCTTFWLPAVNFEPRTTFERLAKQIFDFHTKDLKSDAEIDWEQSGAEYWTQKRDLNTNEGDIEHKSLSTVSMNASSGGVLENDETMIRFHFDKDEELVDQSEGSIIVHPQLSTITYLTDGGNPTLIFPFRQPPSAVVTTSADGDGDGDSNGDVDAEDKENGEIKTVHKINQIFASYPKLGKHVSFDGRFLHGCPSTLSIAPPPDGIRMTFLVNIWLNWKPLGPEVYAEEDLPLLSDVPVELANLITKPNNSTSIDRDVNIASATAKVKNVEPMYTHIQIHSDNTSATESQSQLCTAYFGPLGWDHTLEFSWPNKLNVQTTLVEKQCSSVCVACTPIKPCQIYSTVRPLLTTVPTVAYTPNLTPQQISKSFLQSKVLLIKHMHSPLNLSHTMTSCLKSVQKLYQQFPNEVNNCWQVDRNSTREVSQYLPSGLFVKNSLLSGVEKESNSSEALSLPLCKKQRLSRRTNVSKQKVGMEDLCKNDKGEVNEPWQVQLNVCEAVNSNLFQQAVAEFYENTDCPALFNSNNNFGSNRHNISPSDSISLRFGLFNNNNKSSTLNVLPVTSRLQEDDDAAEEEDADEVENDHSEEEEEEEEEEEYLSKRSSSLASQGPRSGTYFLPLCGPRASCFIQPDESQDWCTAPPPVTIDQKPLHVEVSVGDVLLINKQFWMQSEQEGGDSDDVDKKVCEGEIGDGLYFIVSRDFTC